MRIYGEPAELRGVQDTLLLDWWQGMVISGEIGDVFGPGCLELSTFMAAMQWPTRLMFETDENGKIWIAAWLDPAPFAGAFLGLWIAKEKRLSRETWVTVLEVLHAALHPDTGHPIVIVVTHDERVAHLHRHFGFERAGVIPKMVWGKDLTINYLDRELLAAASAHFKDSPWAPLLATSH